MLNASIDLTIPDGDSGDALKLKPQAKTSSCLSISWVARYCLAQTVAMNKIKQSVADADTVDLGIVGFGAGDFDRFREASDAF